MNLTRVAIGTTACLLLLLLASPTLAATSPFADGSAAVGVSLPAVFASPALRIFLLSVFLFSFYVAVHMPGHGVPEVIATVSLAILLAVPLISGAASPWVLLTLVTGLALLIAEVFLLPGFGICGVAGLLFFFSSLIYAFAAGAPDPRFLSVSPTSLLRATLVIIAGMAGSMFLWLWLGRYLPELPYFNRLVLAPPPETTSEVLLPLPAVGASATAVTDLRPAGRARFPDTGLTADVVSDAGFVRADSPLTVTAVYPDRILVRPA